MQIADHNISETTGKYAVNVSTNNRNYLQMRELIPENTVNDLPPPINYNAGTQRPEYTVYERTRAFRPVVFDDGKRLKFMIYSQEFMDPKWFTFVIEVTNPNMNNFLQLDGTPHSIIKRIKFSHDGLVIEELNDYDVIVNLLNDMTYKSNFFNDNNHESSNPFTVGTQETLIHPSEYGTHMIFNPPQISFKYTDCRQVTNGLLDMKPKTKHRFEIKLFSHIFGLSKKVSRYVPLFLFSKGLEVEIELNPHAFFVPVFNAHLQDVINANINNAEYSIYRTVMSELSMAKKLSREFKNTPILWNNIPRTATSKTNTTIVPTIGLGNCLFEALSLGLTGDITKASKLRKEALTYIRSNMREMDPIIIYDDPKSYESESFISSIYSKFKNNPFGIWKRSLGEPENMMDIDSGEMDKITKNVEEYVTEHSESGIMGGRPELVAISKIYSTPIEIYDAEINFIYIICPLFTNPPIKLRYADSHYDLLVDNSKRFNLGGVEFQTRDFFNLTNIEKNFQVLSSTSIPEWGELINWDLLMRIYSDTQSKKLIESEMKTLSAKYPKVKNPMFFDFISKTIPDLWDPLKIVEIENAMLSGYFTKIDQFIKSEFKSKFTDNVSLKKFRPFMDILPAAIGTILFNESELITALYTSATPIKLSDFAKDNGLTKLREFVTRRIIVVEDVYTFIQKLMNKGENLTDEELKKRIEKAEKDIMQTEKAGVFGNLLGKMGNTVRKFTNLLTRRKKINEDFLAYFQDNNNYSIKKFLEDNNQTISDPKFVLLRNNVFGVENFFNARFTNDMVFTKSDMLSIISNRTVIMNTMFLKKLNIMFGPVGTVQILTKYIPKMFLSTQEKELMQLLASNRYEDCVNLISKDFFKGFTTMKSFVEYNPFDVKKSIVEKLDKENKLFKKMFELGKKFINFNFSFVPEGNYLLPVTGILGKISSVLNDNIGSYPIINLQSTVHQNPLTFLYNFAMFSTDKKSLIGGSNLRKAFNESISEPMMSLSTSMYSELNSTIKKQLVKNLLRAIDTKIKEELKRIQFMESSSKIDELSYPSLESIANTLEVGYSTLDPNVLHYIHSYNPLSFDISFGIYVSAQKALDFYRGSAKANKELSNLIMKTLSIGCSMVNNEYRNPQSMFGLNTSIILDSVLSYGSVPIKTLIRPYYSQNATSASILPFVHALGQKTNLLQLLIMDFHAIDIGLESMISKLQNDSKSDDNIKKREEILIGVINEYLKPNNDGAMVNKVNFENEYNTIQEQIILEKIKLSKIDSKILETKVELDITPQNNSSLISSLKTEISKLETDKKIVDDAIKNLIVKQNVKIKERQNQEMENNEIISQQNTVQNLIVGRFDTLLKDYQNAINEVIVSDVFDNIEDKMKFVLAKLELRTQLAKIDDVIVLKNIFIKIKKYLKSAQNNKEDKEFRMDNDYGGNINNYFTELINIENKCYEIFNENKGNLKIDESDLLLFSLPNSDTSNFICDINGRLLKYDQNTETYQRLYLSGKETDNPITSMVRSSNRLNTSTSIKKLIEKITLQSKLQLNEMNPPTLRIVVRFSTVLKDYINKINNPPGSAAEKIKSSVNLFKNFENALKRNTPSTIMNMFSKKRTPDEITNDKNTMLALIQFIIREGDFFIASDIAINSIGEQNVLATKFYFDNLRKIFDAPRQHPEIIDAVWKIFMNMPAPADNRLIDLTIESFVELFSKFPREAIIKKQVLGYEKIEDLFNTFGIPVDAGDTVMNELKLKKFFYYSEPNSSEYYKVAKTGYIVAGHIKYTLLHKIKSSNMVDVIPPPSPMTVSQCLIYMEEVIESCVADVTDIAINISGKEAVIVNYLLNIVELLVKTIDKRVNLAMLTQIVPIFASVARGIKSKRVISHHDSMQLVGLSDSLNSIIKNYNLIHSTKFKTLEDSMIDLTDPKTFIDISKHIEESYPVFMKQRLARQSNFVLLNEESNISQQLDVSRNYTVSSCFLQINEVQFQNKDFKAKIYNEGFRIISERLEVIGHNLFQNIPPITQSFSLYQQNIKNMFQVILNNAYLKYDTYRKSNRYSRKISTLGIDIGGVKFPPNFIIGDASNSGGNADFINQVHKCIGWTGSLFNNLNMSLDTSTSMFVTKKSYANPDTSLFEFDSKTDLQLDFTFGYTNELVGKCVFGINLEELDEILGRKINIKDHTIVVTNESMLDKSDQNSMFSFYEMFTLLQFEQVYVITKDGYLENS